MVIFSAEGTEMPRHYAMEYNCVHTTALFLAFREGSRIYELMVDSVDQEKEKL